MFKAGTRKRLPYVASIAVSVALIITYVASRTVGVPIVGVEYYVGRLDVVSEFFQAIVIGISGFALFNMKAIGKRCQMTLLIHPRVLYFFPKFLISYYASINLFV